MFIKMVSFVHLVTVISVVALSLYAWFRSLRFNTNSGAIRFCRYTDYFLLGLLVINAISGSLLIHPKGFLVTTSWVRAAYELLAVSCFLLLLHRLLQQKLKLTNLSNKKFGNLVPTIHYSLLLALFFIIIHDAVAKRTLF